MGNNWTVGKKLFTGIGVLVAMLLVSGAMAIWSSSMLKGQLDTAIQKTTKKISLSHEVLSTAVRLRSEQRRTLVAAFGNDHETVAKATARVNELVKQNEASLDEVSKLIVTEEGKRIVAEVRQLQKEWRATHEELDALVAKGENKEAWELARTKSNPLVDQIDEKANTFLEAAERVPEAVRGGGPERLQPGQDADPGAAGDLGAGCRRDRLLGEEHHGHVAVDGEPAARGRRAGGRGVLAGLHVRAVAVAGRHRTGRLARGDVGLDGGDGLDDAPERRERAAGRRR